MEHIERPIIEVHPTFNPDRTYTFTVDQFVFHEISKALKVVEGKRNAELRFAKKHKTQSIRNRGIICPAVRIIDPTPPPIVLSPAPTVSTPLQLVPYVPHRAPRPPEAPPSITFNYAPVLPSK